MSADQFIQTALSWAVIIFFCAIAAGALAALHDEFFPPDQK